MVLTLISVLERRASVKHLEAMDDRELADLGISRSEISAAVGGSCRPPDLFAFSRSARAFKVPEADQQNRLLGAPLLGGGTRESPAPLQIQPDSLLLKSSRNGTSRHSLESMTDRSRVLRPVEEIHDEQTTHGRVSGHVAASRIQPRA